MPVHAEGVLKVRPRGYTTSYAPPEVLTLVVAQTSSGQRQGDGYIENGSAADVWSSAVVLYQLLTSTLPFDAPTEVNKSPEARQRRDADTLQAQQSWVCLLALPTLGALFTGEVFKHAIAGLAAAGKQDLSEMHQCRADLGTRCHLTCTSLSAIFWCSVFCCNLEFGVLQSHMHGIDYCMNSFCMSPNYYSLFCDMLAKRIQVNP